jgi:murein L,D-transpeptidase YcbB/YkuD
MKVSALSHLFIFLFILIFSYCKQKGNNHLNAQSVKRDTSITTPVSHNQLFFDSTRMENFIRTQKFHDSLVKRLRAYYNSRNYQYAWFFEDGIAEYAGSFYETYNDYIAYSGDSSLFSLPLKKDFDSLTNGNYIFKADDELVFQTELLLTAQFFRYSRRAYMGQNQINPRELEWFIPRKKINPSALLDTLLVHKGKNFTAYEPVHPQYNLLKDYLLKYYEIERAGGWNPIKIKNKSLKLGDTASVVPAIKHHLFLTGDLPKDDKGTLYDSEMEKAVKSFERRYGFKEDGIIIPTHIAEMNRPVSERLHQILINMERIRWVSIGADDDYLLVNIPEFKLHVIEKGKQQFEMNVIVGKEITNTGIFTARLKYVVFSPFWNVPASILVKEIQPSIRINKNYLATNHMEWSGGGVRQKPGPWNALGLVKFLFPNSFGMYMHDTPTKSLFEREKRTFSHGCIRIAEPKKLADYLLRNDPAWDSLKIAAAMNAGKEQYVTLKQNTPVFIAYFTAWVDQFGKLNFRDDVYGYDKKMKSHLFGK